MLLVTLGIRIGIIKTLDRDLLYETLDGREGWRTRKHPSQGGISGAFSTIVWKGYQKDQSRSVTEIRLWRLFVEHTIE